MTTIAATHDGGDHASHHEETFVSKYIFPTDHKRIAMQYLMTGLVMFAVGGFMAYVFRMQLAYPGASVPLFGEVDAATYNALITNHATIMIFWVAMPMLIAAFGNYLIPLMIGADDMVFPRLNRLSYQIFFISTIILMVAWLVPGGAFGGSWTSYPPLSSRGEFNGTPIGAPMWVLAVALEIVAFLLGGINFMATTMNSRAPGMKMMDIPIVVWFINIAVLLFMFSVGPLVAGAVLLLLDQTVGTSFYVPTGGGDPVIFQHLFWFFGHPEVYVILIPELGIVAEIITTFARKKIFGYRIIIWTMIVTGILSLVVWAHHQFIAGIDPRMAVIFSITTIMISIPLALIYMLLIATLYGGSIEFKVPMLWAMGMMTEFLVGGLTGIYLGSSAIDIYMHDNTFVMAHFHYTLMPVVFFGGWAGITFWFPKFFGRMLNETLGKIHFWGSTISFNFIFIPLFFLGMSGQQRKIFDYSAFPDINTAAHQDLRVFATTAFLVFIAFQFVFVFNFFKSMMSGPVAGNNPWNSNTLDWQCPSPPPHGNFAELPTVYRGPYEYSVPGRESDFWPQNEPA